MAFAPHANDHTLTNKSLPVLLGRFRHKETDCAFEYAERIEREYLAYYPHLVYVGPNGETRYALVLKTVAYIVVDEDEYGQPVVEKWKIKQHKEYLHPSKW